MTEQQIQNKRIRQLEAEGYYVLKLIMTNKNGIPDLLAIPPNSDVLFSEIKGAHGKDNKHEGTRFQGGNRFVKTSYDEFIKPTMKYADIIVPKGKSNTKGIEFVVNNLKL